jgi:hypothetical protein
LATTGSVTSRGDKVSAAPCRCRVDGQPDVARQIAEMKAIYQHDSAATGVVAANRVRTSFCEE